MSNKSKTQLKNAADITEVQGVITPIIIDDSTANAVEVVDANLVDELFHEIADDLNIAEEIQKLEELETKELLAESEDNQEQLEEEAALLEGEHVDAFEDTTTTDSEETFTSSEDANASEELLEDSSGEIDVSESVDNVNSTDVEENIDPNSRAALLSEIRKFYQLLDMPLVDKNFEHMDDIALLEHVRLLRINNGGTLNMATTLNKAEIEYDNYLRSDLMKMRMGLIAEKGADFVAVAQKIRQLVGNDFVISKARSTEYHNMLKSATSTISVLHEKITQIASLLGLTFNNDSLNPRGDIIPIVEGMPADPRIAIAVLNTLMAYIDKFNSIQNSNVQQLARNAIKIKTLEENKQVLERRNQEVQEHAASVLRMYEEYTTKNCFWLIVDTRKGSILRKINPEDKVVNASQLDLRGTLDTGFKFYSKSAASTWAKRLMQTDRFANRVLVVKRVSVVLEN